MAAEIERALQSFRRALDQAHRAAQRARSDQLIDRITHAQQELKASRDEIAAIVGGIASGIVAHHGGIHPCIPPRHMQMSKITNRTSQVQPTASGQNDNRVLYFSRCRRRCQRPLNVSAVDWS